MSKSLKIAVIGIGASGIMTVIKLREIGQTDVSVFEKGPDMGGTWRENRYPGVACDVPSHLYRFSFAPNPDWTHVCASGSEILSYLRKVYEDNDIARHVTFSAEVKEARWNGTGWDLETAAGAFGPFDVVISAMGILRHPIYPDIQGLQSFAGTTVHSARWDEAIALDGRRIGVIGTGSTATQIVSATVGKAGKLTQFQRTPQWIMPLPNLPIPDEQRDLFRRDPAAMQAYYDKLAHDFNSKFAAAVVGANPPIYAHMERMCQQNLEESVADPVLREKLRPNYKVGCKRLVMSDSYYQAIQQANAELVTDAIDAIEPKGVRTVDGRLHELDVLVLATGYDAHSTFHPMTVTGKDGLSIEEAWRDAAEAYLAVAIPNFPNLFVIGGPNSPIGNFSYLMTAETQCSYIVKLVGLLADGKADALSPNAETTKTFNQSIRERMTQTIWSTGCRSWYQDKNGNIASWPWTYEDFTQMLSNPKLEDYDVHEAVHG